MQFVLSINSGKYSLQKVWIANINAIKKLLKFEVSVKFYILFSYKLIHLNLFICEGVFSMKLSVC